LAWSRDKAAWLTFLWSRAAAVKAGVGRVKFLKEGSFDEGDEGGGGRAGGRDFADPRS
jgi:hypothetical protein